MSVRTGEPRLRKRERTQRQLVEAAMRVFAERGIGGAPVQAIAAAAGLANGTFYNHFSSKEELVAAVGAHLMDQVADRIAASVRDRDDPAEWVAVALRRFSEKAREDPIWGSVTVRLGASVSKVSRRIAANMTRDLDEGIRRGRFEVPARQAAADVVFGAGLMSVLSVSNRRAGSEHACHVAAMTLRALGIDAAEAHEIAHRPLPPLGEAWSASTSSSGAR